MIAKPTARSATPATRSPRSSSQSGKAAIRIDHLRHRPHGRRVGARETQVEATVLGWPLVASGDVVGVLVGVDHGRAQRLPVLSPELVDALALLVEPAAFALAHALRVARAEALSVTDDLTQLYNSRYLNDALRKETKRAMRSGWPLSLLFIDLDGFKRINDAHGHLLGSRALIEAAAVIRGERPRNRHRRAVRRRRVRDPPARNRDWRAPMRSPAASATASSGYVFLADRSPGNRISASIGLATLPGCRRYGRRAPPGGRCGDVSC